ncbi:MAG: FliM/FliN family flagellar motor switch protein [Pseudomonadota bacterium]
MARAGQAARARPPGALSGGAITSDNLRPARVDPDRPFPSSRGVLSAAEIEALLRPDLPEPPPPPEETAPRPLADLDTASTPCSQDDAERLSARLALAIHRATGLAMALKVTGVAERSFRAAFPEPEPGAASACYGRAGGDVDAVMAVSSPACLALVELSCGAGIDEIDGLAGRELTDIDTALLERFLAPLTAHLPGGHLHCLEGRSGFALSLAPPGQAIQIDLELGIGDFTAPARLILARSAWEDFAKADAPQPAAESRPRNGRELTAVLTARIASLSVPVSRLANLKPGDTLLLGLPPDAPVELLSGGRGGTKAAEGELGRRGAKIAVRVTQLGPALR